MTARILIVDDTPLNLKLLTAKLARDYYIVSTAENGPEALEKAEKENPDLILLDVMMPEMNGFEVCERLKREPHTANIPVVMVTALTDVTDRVQGLRAGADDFLSKPINDIALMARVRSLLRMKMIMDEWRLREKTSHQFIASEKSDEDIDINQTPFRVLLVEDDKADEAFIKQTLETNMRASVDSADKVTDAASMVRTGFYDVIISSLDLRNEDGLMICPQIRSNEATRHIPILMTANEMEMDRVGKSLDLGANDYILRPIDTNELLARVRNQLKHKRYYERLRKNYESSMALAMVDPLTGAFNRRYFDAHLPRMLSTATGIYKPLTVLMIDIDHFKKINDTYGHASGDSALKTVVERVMNSVRPSDLVARMGGEEFAVLMPETPLAAAQSIAERLRARVADTPIALADEQKTAITVTVSIGCACVQNDDPQETPASLLARADAALYEAKQTGRNKVVCDQIKKPA